MLQMSNNINLRCFNWKCDWNLFINYLYSLEDIKYRDFSKKITPGEFTMIGIRIPRLREISKEIYKSDYTTFLKLDDHNIFEVRLLKGFVIAQIKDLNLFRNYFDEFLSYINNWAICDSFLSSAKIIRKDRDYFFQKASNLLINKNEFENRVAFVLLLNYFVTEDYIYRLIDLIDGYRSDKYYANMALGWLLSIMYIKFRDITTAYLLKANLSSLVKKITFSKIRDSYRVTKDEKENLKKMINFS